MNLIETLTNERSRLTMELAELDARRGQILRELAVVDDGLRKLDAGKPEEDAPRSRGRGEDNGRERVRRLLHARPGGATVDEIAVELDLTAKYVSNCISHLNNVEKVLEAHGRSGGKTIWVMKDGGPPLLP